MDIIENAKWAVENYPALSAILGLGGTGGLLGLFYAIKCWILPKALRQNTCLILGQGGTGKTTLIRQITGDTKVNSIVETEEFKLHEYSVKIRKRDHRIVLADYRGQDLGVLTRGLLEIESHGGRRRDISSMIVMIDICNTNKRSLPDPPTSPIPNYEHLAAQLEQWTGQALNAVLGLLGESQIRSVTVFVNKIDLLSTVEKTEQLLRIEEICKPLQSRLRESLPQVPIDLVLGSATKGSASEIRDRLSHFATPVT